MGNNRSVPDFLHEESWLGFQVVTSAEIIIMKPIHIPYSTFSVSITLCKVRYNISVLIQKIGIFNTASQLPGGR